jgi:hypothetical protein
MDLNKLLEDCKNDKIWSLMGPETVSKTGSDAFCKKYEKLCPDTFWNDNMFTDIDDD